MAPWAFRSAAVTGEPFLEYPTMILPSLSFRSERDEDRQNTAMTSLATVMSKPSSLTTPFFLPSPATIDLSSLSFISMARRIVMVEGSISSSLPWKIWLSTMAHRRLLAASMAWKSPLKWRLMSAMGATWAIPPPVAPPLTPKTGPMLGSLRASTAFLPIRLNPSPSPMVVVVFPSPRGVGVIAVTRISFPSFFPSLAFRKPRSIFAFFLP